MVITVRPKETLIYIYWPGALKRLLLFRSTLMSLKSPARALSSPWLTCDDGDEEDDGYDNNDDDDGDDDHGEGDAAAADDDAWRWSYT